MIIVVKQVEELCPSMKLHSVILQKNIQTIMLHWWKNSNHSMITSLEILRLELGDLMASCLNTCILLEDLPMFKNLLNNSIHAEMNFNENYLDTLLMPTMSTSGTIVPIPTEVVDVPSETNLARLLKRKVGKDDDAETLEKTGYLLSYISCTENGETSKYGLMEPVEDYLYQVN